MKKLLIVAVAILVGAFVVKNVREVRHACHTAWVEAQRNIPIDHKLAAIRGEINSLEAKADEMFRPLGRKKAELEDLRTAVAELRAELDTRKADLLTLTQAIDTQSNQVHYKNADYSVKAAREQLARDFETYKAKSDQLAAEEQLLVQREEYYNTALQQLQNLEATRAQLSSELARLEAEFEQQKLANPGEVPGIELTAIERIEHRLQDVQHELKVRRYETEIRNQVRGSQPQPVATDDEPSISTQDVREYLNGQPAREGRVQTVSQE